MAGLKQEMQQVGVPNLHADRGIVRLGSGCITAKLPPIRFPKPASTDRGTVRLGSGCITAELPPIRLPKPESTDRGNVRLGSGCITAGLPRLKGTLKEE